MTGQHEQLLDCVIKLKIAEILLIFHWKWRLKKKSIMLYFIYLFIFLSFFFSLGRICWCLNCGFKNVTEWHNGWGWKRPCIRLFKQTKIWNLNQNLDFNRARTEICIGVVKWIQPQRSLCKYLHIVSQNDTTQHCIRSEIKKITCRPEVKTHRFWTSNLVISIVSPSPYSFIHLFIYFAGFVQLYTASISCCLAAGNF